jgi:hypothetical protein
VLVPSVPTPMAGAIYILPPGRVHPVDVPLTVAVKVFSKWALAPVTSSGPCKRQSHPRLRRRRPDQTRPGISHFGARMWLGMDPIDTIELLEDGEELVIMKDGKIYKTGWQSRDDVRGTDRWAAEYGPRTRKKLA